MNKQPQELQELIPAGTLAEGMGDPTRSNTRPYLQESHDFTQWMMQKRKETLTIIEGLDREAEALEVQARARRERIDDQYHILNALNSGLHALGEEELLPSPPIESQQIEHQEPDKEE